MSHPSRRSVLAAGAALAASAALPARADAPDVAAEMTRLFGARTPQPGKVELDLPPISETGNSVAVTIRVASPMTDAEHVKAIHLFASGNPAPRVASWRLSPRLGKAELSTRVRMGKSQLVTAVAELSDGSLWSDAKEINVAVGACIEDLI